MSYSFDEILKFKEGERYCESGQYGSVWFTVVGEPEIFSFDQDEILLFFAETDGGDEIEYRITRGLEHYGPKIYDHEAYESIDQLRGKIDEDFTV